MSYLTTLKITFAMKKIEGSIKEFFNFKRTGNSELTDSLIYDDITRFSTKIAGYLKK
jgi:spore photoproduct lyase